MTDFSKLYKWPGILGTIIVLYFLFAIIANSREESPSSKGSLLFEPTPTSFPAATPTKKPRPGGGFNPTTGEWSNWGAPEYLEFEPHSAY